MDTQTHPISPGIFSFEPSKVEVDKLDAFARWLRESGHPAHVFDLLIDSETLKLYRALKAGPSTPDANA